MALFVTMEVGPVDWQRFSRAMEWSAPFRPADRLSCDIYRSQEDPASVLVVERWSTHGAMHAYQDKYGDEFNERAGTQGMEWRVQVWDLAESL
jgi:hypothetical protein